MEYAKTLNEDSIAVILKPERLEARYIDDIINILKENHVKIVLISNTKYSKLNKMADFLLSFNGNLHIVDAFCFDMLVSLLSIEYRKRYLSE